MGSPAKDGERCCRNAGWEASVLSNRQGKKIRETTAMYGGLRRDEPRALRVKDVDLAAGVIGVERGWDPYEGEIMLKSDAGRRRVPPV